MAKAGTVVIELDANTAKLVEGIKKSDRKLLSLQSTVNKTKDTLKNIAVAAGSFYVVKSAVDAAKESLEAMLDVSSQFEQWENRMSAFTNSMADAKSELARAQKFATDFNLSIADTNEMLLTMKNYGLKDSREQLEIYANTAIGAGKSVDQFAEAMADALTGEFERLKEFGLTTSNLGDQIGMQWTDSSGKMRNIIVANNNDIIESTMLAIYNEKYVGQIDLLKNSWKGITQRMSNDLWKFKKTVSDAGLLDYFKHLGTTISDWISGGFGDAEDGAKRFADNTIGFLNGVMKSVGFLSKAINQLFGVLDIAYAGYEKLAGAVMGGNVGDIKSKIEELKRQKAELGNAPGRTLINAEIRALEKKIEQYEEYNAIRRDGDKRHEEALKRTEEINKAIDSMVQQTTSYTNTNNDKQIDALKQKREEVEKAFNNLNAGYGVLNTGTKEADKNTKSMAAHAKEAAGYMGGLASAQERLFEATHTDEEIRMKKLGDELADLGKYLSQADLAKIYESEVGKMKDETQSLGDMLQDALHIENDSLFANLIDGITGAFDGIGDALRGGGNAIGDAIGNLFTKSLDFIMPGLSGIASFVGGLFSDTVSQEEIDAATGRSDFSDESIANIGDMFERVMNPQLEATNTMSRYLRDMNKSFDYIARSLVSMTTTTGVDLTGAGYAPSIKSSWSGFSSKEVSLLGSGIDINGELLDLSIQGYISELVKKSSWWGLKESSSTRTSYFDLDDELIGEFGDVVNAGVSSIVTAGVALGFDENAIMDSISEYTVDIGKVDLSELSDTEVNEKLQNVFSEIFSGAIGEIDGINSLVDEYARVGEDNLETLTRIATEYEQVSYSLSQIGIEFFDSWNGERYEFIRKDSDKYYDSVEKTLDFSSQFSDIDELNDVFSSYINNFFTDSERLEMQSDSLRMSFESLGLEMPRTGDEYRALVEEYSSFTDESGAALLADIIRLGDSFSVIDDALKHSDENIEKFSDSFKEDYELLYDNARELSTPIATNYSELQEIFVNMQGGIDGLTDAELSYLDANKAYIDAISSEKESLRDRLTELKLYDDEEALLAYNRSKELENINDVNRAILESIYAEEDRQKALEEENELLAQQTELSDRLDYLMADDTMKVYIDRQKELAEYTDETSLAILRQIYAEEDRQKALEEENELLAQQTELSDRLDYLMADDTMKVYIDRQKELAEYTDETSLAILNQIYAEEDRQKALKDIQVAIDDSKSAIGSLSDEIVSEYNSSISTMEDSIVDQYDSMVKLAAAYMAVSESIVEYMDDLTHVPVAYANITQSMQSIYDDIASASSSEEYASALDSIKTFYNEAGTAIENEYSVRIDSYKKLIDEQNEVLQQEFDAKKELLEAQYDLLAAEVEIINSYRDFADSIRNNAAVENFDFGYLERMADSTFGTEDSVDYAKSALDAYKEIAKSDSDYMFEQMKTSNKYGSYGDDSTEYSMLAIRDTLDNMEVELLDYTAGVESIEAEKQDALDALKVDVVDMLNVLNESTIASSPDIVSSIESFKNDAIAVLGSDSDIVKWLSSIDEATVGQNTFSAYESLKREEEARENIAAINNAAAKIDVIGAEFSLLDALQNQTATLEKKLSDLTEEVVLLREKTEEQNNVLIENTEESIFEVSA